MDENTKTLHRTDQADGGFNFLDMFEINSMSELYGSQSGKAKSFLERMAENGYLLVNPEDYDGINDPEDAEISGLTNIYNGIHEGIQAVNTDHVYNSFGEEFAVFTSENGNNFAVDGGGGILGGGSGPFFPPENMSLPPNEEQLTNLLEFADFNAAVHPAGGRWGVYNDEMGLLNNQIYEYAFELSGQPKPSIYLDENAPPEVQANGLPPLSDEWKARVEAVYAKMHPDFTPTHTLDTPVADAGDPAANTAGVDPAVTAETPASAEVKATPAPALTT